MILEARSTLAERLDSLLVSVHSSSDWLNRHVGTFFDRLHGHRAPSFGTDGYQYAVRAFNRLSYRLKDFLSHAQYNLKNTDFAELVARVDFFLRSKLTQPNILCFAGGVVTGIIIGYSFWALYRRVEMQSRVRALVCTNYSGIEAVAFVDDFPVKSKCAKREVMIQVKAAGIDTLDIKIASGLGRVWRKFLRGKRKGAKDEFPFPLGRDCSGVVVEIGSSVTNLEVGDCVWAAVPFWYPGTLSEVIILPADWVSRKPTKLGHEAAVAVPYSGLIAWKSVLGDSSSSQTLLKGKRILVHGGSSAIGCLAIQLAKLCGADVTATMPSQSIELAARLGVDEVYEMDDAWSLKLQRVSDRFDLVVNCCGQEQHQQCLAICRPDGKVVTAETPNLKSDGFGFIRRFVFRVWFSCVGLFWLPSFDPVPDRRILDNWAKLIDEGRIQPVVDRAFPFHRSEAALDFAARPNPVGKTVVIMRNRSWSRSEENI